MLNYWTQLVEDGVVMPKDAPSPFMCCVWNFRSRRYILLIVANCGGCDLGVLYSAGDGKLASTGGVASLPCVLRFPTPHTR